MKKEKELTPQQLEKKQQKEQKELARLTKIRDKKKPKNYFLYFMVLIAVIYIADEISTQITDLMKTIVASQIFAPIVGEDVAVAKMSTYGLFAGISTVLVIFYRPLADRYGRKPFLFINTFLMGVGMAAIGTADSIAQYIIGYCIIRFAIPNDIQAVYIYECAPAKYRATFYSIIKSVATLGMMLIPILRNYFVPGDDFSRWHGVFLVPSIIATVVAIVALLLVDESEVFVENRIHMLTMSDEERALAKERKADGQGGLKNGFRYVFAHKQLLLLGAIFGLIGGGVMITSYYEVNLTLGFASSLSGSTLSATEASGLANTMVTAALLTFPVGSAILQALQGPIADTLGRKWASVIMTALSIIMFFLSNVGAQNGWNPYLVGIITGASVGCYWAVGDILTLMRTEMVPTNLRQSVYTPINLMGLIFQVATRVPFLILMNRMGDTKIPFLTMVIAIPSMGIAMLLLLLKMKETKGIDIGSISVTE